MDTTPMLPCRPVAGQATRFLRVPAHVLPARAGRSDAMGVIGGPQAHVDKMEKHRHMHMDVSKKHEFIDIRRLTCR